MNAPTPSKHSAPARRFVTGALGGFLAWLLLTASLALQELLVGVLVAVLAALLAHRQLALLDGLRLSPLLPFQVLRYLVVVLHDLVASVVDLAGRLTSPSPPLRPALVELETSLGSDLGRLLLANTLTLTPGALAVDVVGDHLEVHWLDHAPGSDPERAAHAAVERCERYLRGFVR